MRADKVTLRKGDWVRVNDPMRRYRKQGLICAVDDTHFSIASVGIGIACEFSKSDTTILKIIHRAAINNWWNFL